MGNSAGRLVSGAPLATERERGIERDEGVIRNKLVIHTHIRTYRANIYVYTSLIFVFYGPSSDPTELPTASLVIIVCLWGKAIRCYF